MLSFSGPPFSSQILVEPFLKLSQLLVFFENTTLGGQYPSPPDGNPKPFPGFDADPTKVCNKCYDCHPCLSVFQPYANCDSRSILDVLVFFKLITDSLSRASK